MQPPKPRRPALYWHVFHRGKINTLFAVARANPAIRDEIRSHDGKLLQHLMSELTEIRFSGGTSVLQARLLASNGGSWSSFLFARQNGQLKYTYHDLKTYVYVEWEVLQYWFRSKEIDWDVDAARARVFGEQGDAVRIRLSSGFVPLARSGDEAIRQIKRGEFDQALRIHTGIVTREAMRHAPPPPPKKLRQKRDYHVVDLDHVRQRLEAAWREFDEHSNGHDRPPHEGRIFRSCARLVTISAYTPIKAIDTYRTRVGGWDAILPQGRFLAITPQLTEDVALLLPKLPPRLNQSSLLQTCSLTRKRAKWEAKQERAYARSLAAAERPPKKASTRKRRIIRPVPWRASGEWWNEREPGCDDDIAPGTQMVMVSLMSLAELLEFPPREPVSATVPGTESRAATGPTYVDPNQLSIDWFKLTPPEAWEVRRQKRPRIYRRKHAPTEQLAIGLK